MCYYSLNYIILNKRIIILMQTPNKLTKNRHGGKRLSFKRRKIVALQKLYLNIVTRLNNVTA